MNRDDGRDLEIQALRDRLAEASRRINDTWISNWRAVRADTPIEP